MNSYYEFKNLPLPYAYDALEPFIDEKTMELHHDRHLQTYINNLNTILSENENLQTFSLEQLLRIADRLPQNLKTPVKNNAGGVFNHRFFFCGMCPDGANMPIGNLAGMLTKTFGGIDEFKEEFKKAALSVFGSGYAWLVTDKNGRLRIITSANQNTPIAAGLCPVLCIDVWEHAYYLKHYNNRSDYIDDWFNVVCWERADDNYMRCFLN